MIFRVNTGWRKHDIFEVWPVEFRNTAEIIERSFPVANELEFLKTRTFHRRRVPWYARYTVPIFKSTLLGFTRHRIYAPINSSSINKLICARRVDGTRAFLLSVSLLYPRSMETSRAFPCRALISFAFARLEESYGSWYDYERKR